MSDPVPSVSPMASPTRATARSGRPVHAAGRSPGYRCAECGWTAAKWVGRCGECQAWGTLAEAGGPITARTAPAAHLHRPAQPITEVDGRQAANRSTGIGELDRVLGGGVVSGTVVLLAGEPGIGKSTLLLDVAARAAATGQTTLYVSAEESAAQVRIRAERTGALVPGLLIAAETDLATILAHVEAVDPDLLVVDSVQAVASAEVDGSAGNVGQVKEVAASLIQVAKNRGLATFLVGHVTKDGAVAGPRTLEHLVDVVVHFEGERHSRLRLVRAVKNRFGPFDEVGCFEMSDAGIVGLADPSGLFLTGRDLAVAGTSVCVTLEGRRPLVVEVQALLAETRAPAPRRTTSGLDASRVAMILAVLQRHARIPVQQADCYVATIAGVRIGEPAADLGIALAIASSIADRAVPPGTIAVGEVGLAGELRHVAGVGRRLAEAARLGFRWALVPDGSLQGVAAPAGLRVTEAATLVQALRVVLHPEPTGAGERSNGGAPAAGEPPLR